MKLELRHVGPITKAELSFGDLTVLVGPQASGKSIALQMLRLMVDNGYVQKWMLDYGLDWSGKVPEFFDAYFGEGMRGIWKVGRSGVWWKGEKVEMEKHVTRRNWKDRGSLFFIPAQRVLVLRNGWPRPFSDYSPGDPFAVRDFSQELGELLEKDYAASDNLFPQKRRLKSELREMLERAVFHTFSLRVEKFHSQKRLVLRATDEQLPFMVWSAGQREFVPLLLGMYFLMPPTRVGRRDIRWVVVEEPEMGLHPRALDAVILMLFDLVTRGYHVCVSTHSPQVLDAIWSLRHLRENHADPRRLLDVFAAVHTRAMLKLARNVMEKDVKVFYFGAEGGQTRDISDLDPTSEESGDAGWGGLTEFSGRANAAVADAVANADQEARP
jgi:hypothetical protein